MPPATVRSICFVTALLASFPAAADTTVAVSDVEITPSESGSTPLPFVLTRGGDAQDAVRILVETAPGGSNPAVAGEDYLPLSPGTEVVMGPGVTSTTVNVMVNRRAVGSDETLLLRLTAAQTTHPEPRLTSASWTLPIAGSFPSSMAVIDLNDDGALDLVTGNDLSLDITVLLSDGRGGFAPASVHRVLEDDGPPLQFTVLVAAGDVTGDGSPDLLAAGFDTPAVRLLAGDGKGGFADAVSISLATAAPPTDMKLADVNGDGRLDIVLAIGLSDVVAVLLDDGQGGFASAQSFPSGGGPGAIAVADVNGDGDLDIVTANEGGNDVSLLAGDGTGAFAEPVHLSLGPDATPVAIAVADADGDGRLDILTGNRFAPEPGQSGTVSLLRGDSSGGFVDAEQLILGSSVPRGPSAGPPAALAVGDLTGDTHPDLVVTLPLGDQVAVLAGDGAGNFAPATTFPTGGSPIPMVLADVTGDGHLDVVTGNASGESISVLPSDGAGRIGFAGHFGAGQYPHSVVAVDLDGDGLADVATANAQSNDVSVLINDGAGGFLTAVRSSVGAAPSWIAAGDVDDDGALDLITANASGSVSVLRGDGSGGFAEAVDFAVAEGFQSPYAVALGDVNGDARLDIVTANTNVEADGISLLLGDGAGGFGEPTLLPVGAGPFHDPHSIALADVNGDGHLDIVTANTTSNDLSILAGDGAGGFADAVHASAGDGPVLVMVAEVTGDGDPDLVALNHTAQTISVLAGRGSGELAEPAHFPIFGTEGAACQLGAACPWAWGMTLADVTGDGHLDVITGNTDNDTVSVLPNDGAGNFSSFAYFYTGASPGAVAVADVTGDGNPDVITANRSANTISVLANELGRVEVLDGEAVGTIVGVQMPDPPLPESPLVEDDGCGCSATQRHGGGGAFGVAPLVLAALAVRVSRRTRRALRSVG